MAILGFETAPTKWEYPLVLLEGLGRALFATRPPLQPIIVLELGAEKPGDIRYSVDFLSPWLKVGVVTSIGPIHLNPGQFSSVGAIEQEKSILIEALPRDGWAILNTDDPATKRMAKGTQAKVVWFADRGLDTPQEIAKSVGKVFRQSPKEIATALRSFQRPYGRLNLFAGVKGSVLIDDSYNANPMSMQEGLAYLAKQSALPAQGLLGQGRRIAVLGDMLELGEQERLYHQQIGKLARKGSDTVVGVGKRARWYQPTYHFATPLETASFLKKFVRAGDTVLVKGSQSMRMELISQALLACATDAEKLPRQTPAWKAKSFVQP